MGCHCSGGKCITLRCLLLWDMFGVLDKAGDLFLKGGLVNL
jgi:hypothetical protein